MALLKPRITPHLWFDTQAREAAQFYCSIFPDSRITRCVTLRETPSGDAEAISFVLAGQPFMAISAGPHFRFSEAISFVVQCDTQEEIDHYWHALSAHPDAEQCGWLKDRYGLSWQIVPSLMDTIMAEGHPEKMARVTQAFLTMKKFDLEALRRAYAGA